MGVHRKSPLQSWDLGASGLQRGCDAGRWLRWQIDLELLEQQLLVGIELGIAAEDQGASVGCREMHVEHLDGREFVQQRAGRQARSQRPQTGPQMDVQAVGQKGDKDVRFHSPLQLMENGAQAQVVLEVFEGRFHLRELNVKLPQLLRFLRAQVAAQQIPPLPLAHLAQLVRAQLERDIGRANFLSLLRGLNGD